MIVGVVGDLHLPFEHPCYMEFCYDVFKAWKVEKVVFIGDVIDQHAISFWDTDPDALSASSEADAAKDRIQSWHRRFNSDGTVVCIGNHDARHLRTAAKAGIPSRYVRDLPDVFDTPNWKWDWSFTCEGVLYEHGTGSSGKFAAYNRALQKRTSLVMGHVHSGGGVLYHANETSRIFGLNVGCGVDISRYAFAYGKHQAIRPTLGCGIVIDGVHGIFEPMLMGPKEPYHRRSKR